MSYLSPASKKAIANLRAYASPATNWYKCPLPRRAAVLILLFADKGGDLRVVLTIRSSGLKNYAGQAALPGGKADTLTETPFMTARREAFEEIGLPMTDGKLPAGYSVEHLTELPANLAMTELGVRPCVAWLKAPEHSSSSSSSSGNDTGSGGTGGTTRKGPPDTAQDILPKLDAREVAAVFTAPFRNFLHAADLDETARRNVPGDWYKGSWHSWHESAWRMHQFFVPVSPSTVFLAKNQKKGSQRRGQEDGTTEGETGTDNPAVASSSPSPVTSAAAAPSSTNKASTQQSSPSSTKSTMQPPLPKSFYKPQTPTNSNDPLSAPRYRVFGMTARILVDCARVAYGREPEYEHNSHFGDEEMIERLLRIGRLAPVKREGETLTREVMNRAKDVKL